ncbi:MAG TPA: thioredoxin domain-containing protein [Candidatus Paceibacterota bacterium]|nr:thioredoxin domain-containing protein [Candidatus Paceibacterota bacterium]
MAQNNKATLWFIIGFVVLIIVGLIVASVVSSGSSSGSSGFVSTTAPGLSVDDWRTGNPDAKVTLVEYGDFECPACGQYFPIVEQLVQNYSSTVLFVFRNFPLYSVHPDAGISAQAAEAAGLIGGPAKYWQMNNLLYEKQNDWATIPPDQVVSAKFDGYAQSLGLNVATFNSDLTATSVLQKIQSDVNGGNSAQIDHTPTFFVNFQQIQNPANYNDFASVIDQAIAASSTKK